MAYLFSKLNETIDGAASGLRRGSDVLQGGAPQQDRENLGAPGQAPGIASQPSAVIGGAQGAQGPKAGEAAPSINSESRGKVFAKNQQGISANVTGGVTGGIAKAGQALQDEANKYATANTYQAFDQGAANKAIDTGDADATAATSAFLNGAAPKVEEFGFKDASLEGLRDSTRTLQSREGLANQIAQQSGMSQGEARLDAQFLERSGAAGRQRAEAARAFADLQAKTDAEGAKAKQLVADSTKAREQDVAAIQNLLRSRVSDIQQTAAQRRAAGEAQAASETAFARDRERAALEEMIRSYRQNLDAREKTDAYGVDVARNALKGFEASNLDRFIGGGGPALTDSMFLSDEDVAAANRANMLLGEGGRLARQDMAKGNIALQRDAARKELERLLSEGLRMNDQAAAQRKERESRQATAQTVVAASQGKAGAAGGTKREESLNPVDTAKKGVAGAAKSTVAAVAPKNAPKTVVQAAKAPAKAAVSVAKKADEKAKSTAKNTAKALFGRK